MLRSFAVRSDHAYTVMFGGLARVNDDSSDRKGLLVTAPDGGLAKDVWIVGREPVTPQRVVLPQRRPEIEGELVRAGSASFAMVPRVLSDMFWFGRYAERAEDLLRLVLATRTVAIETDLDVTRGRALGILLQAVTHLSTAYPGFLNEGAPMMPELRSMLLDRHRTGTVSQSIGALSLAAQGVRDQLSDDVWMVLAEIERALAALTANPYDQGLQLTDASERCCPACLPSPGSSGRTWSATPAGTCSTPVAGSSGRSRCLRCPGHRLPGHAVDTDRLVTEGVLTAAESIVTFRRRYRTRIDTEGIVELLVSTRSTRARWPTS